jgi:SAM-dependent methyltransferase
VREQRLVFGEVAGEYDDVRAGYPAELVDAVISYAGGPPAPVVDVGAGTGKATAAFRAAGVPVTCVEPDPAMAAVLRRRHPDVEVALCRFEDWVPPRGGVPVLVSAQAWHWVEPARRRELAHRALSPRGVLALFGHEYRFADPPVEAAVHAQYAVHAPELLDDPATGPPTMTWLTGELSGTPLFTDVRSVWFRAVVPYPTDRYLRLLSTFSPHRMLAPQRRAALYEAIAAAAHAHGGVVRQRLETLLVLARRVPEC